MLSTATFRLISKSSFSKAKFQKEDMVLSTKVFGERLLLLSRCSKYSQKVQSETSSVNVRLCKLCGIQTL